MKLTFIYPEFSLNRTPHYHPGLAALAGALKAAGHQSSLIHLAGPTSERELVEAVAAQSPQIIGFNANSHTFRHVRTMSRWLKARFDLPIICGGVHPSLDPVGVSAEESIDMVCVGEGDRALVALCDALERGDTAAVIPSIWSKRNSELIAAPTGALVEDLDTLPLPDREIFDWPALEESRGGAAIFMASRGCPYRCSYCSNSRLRRLYPNPKSYVRFRSVGKVLDEIEQVIQAHPSTKFICFLDDVFPLKRSWLRQFSSEYRRRVGLPFRCNSRPDLIDEEVVRLLADAGCQKVHMGVESGNDRIRMKVLKRPISRQRIVDAFAACRRAGLVTQSFNLLGVPFENPRTILDTIKLNAEIQPDVLIKTIYYPYPNTALHAASEAHQFLTGREYDTFLEGAVISQPTLSQDQVLFAFQAFHLSVKAYALVNRLPRPVRSAFDRAMTLAFSWRAVPHGPLARFKRALVGQLRRRVLPPLKRRLPGMHLYLRSRFENPLQVYED